MMLEVVHVAERVDADGAAHKAHDEHHDHRKLIAVERLREHMAGALGERHVCERDHANGLNEAENEGEPVLVAHGMPQDDRAEHDVDRREYPGSDVARLLGQREGYVADEQVLHRERHSGNPRYRCRRNRNDVALGFAPEQHEQYRRDERYGDKRRDETHVSPPQSMDPIRRVLFVCLLNTPNVYIL